MIRKIIIFAGGTGGHILPALVVIKKLQKRNNICLICDYKGKEYIDNNFKCKIIVLSFKPFIKKTVKLLCFVFSFCYDFFRIFFVFFVNNPSILVSFGGSGTTLTYIMAIIFKVPIYLHEQNAFLGRSNRIFLWFSTKIMLSFPKTLGINKKWKNKILITSLPIRKFNVIVYKKENFKIFVMGGSQGASIFTNVIPVVRVFIILIDKVHFKSTIK